MLEWDDPSARYFEHGLDRGVLYPPVGDPVPWNGLMNFDEGAAGASNVLYRDGVIYLAEFEASDFSGKLTAMYYPDAFRECVGMPEAADGFMVDNQKPKQFGFAYRTLVGSGEEGDMFGYQIHLVYQAMATIGTRGRATMGSTVEPMPFTFDIVCVPVRLQGYRPTAHFIIDTRGMAPNKVRQIERILYGYNETVGRLPDPNDLYDILNYGNLITFTLHEDGTYTVEGSNKNVFAIDRNSFRMKNINATAVPTGKWHVSTGGTTIVNGTEEPVDPGDGDGLIGDYIGDYI